MVICGSPQALATVPSSSRQGHATALVRELERALSSAGVGRLVAVVPGSEAARHPGALPLFSRKLGLQPLQDLNLLAVRMGCSIGHVYGVLMEPVRTCMQGTVWIEVQYACWSLGLARAWNIWNAAVVTRRGVCRLMSVGSEDDGWVAIAAIRASQLEQVWAHHAWQQWDVVLVAHGVVPRFFVCIACQHCSMATLHHSLCVQGWKEAYRSYYATELIGRGANILTKPLPKQPRASPAAEQPQQSPAEKKQGSGQECK